MSLRGLERPEERENMDEDLGEFLFTHCGVEGRISQRLHRLSHTSHVKNTNAGQSPAFVFLTSWLFGCSLCWDAVTGLFGFICMRVTLQVWSWF